MSKIKSFTDMNGKKGKVGSKVHHWMDGDFGRNLDKVEVLTVSEIWRQGAAGTRIRFEGDPTGCRASNYVIIKEDSK